VTPSSDSLTVALMTRIVDRRASVFSRIVLRSLIRAAIDVTCEERMFGEVSPDEYETILATIEQTVRDALKMVRVTG
jgi:hypothetical protein